MNDEQEKVGNYIYCFLVLKTATGEELKINWANSIGGIRTVSEIFAELKSVISLQKIEFYWHKLKQLSSIHTDTTIQKQYDLKTLLNFCRVENLFDKVLAYKNLLTKVFGVWNIDGIE